MESAKQAQEHQNDQDHPHDPDPKDVGTTTAISPDPFGALL
jgi:hypothetical protein